MNLLLSINILWASLMHVGHIAEYHYVQAGSRLDLKFVIEKEELLGFDLSDACDQQAATALCATQYINENTTCQINGKTVFFQLQNSKTDSDHLIIYLSAKLEEEKVDKISIEAKGFYEFNPEFMNRIVVNISKFQSSYLLLKDDKSINLE
ncbi:MAG: hypothetical protein JXQ96_19915 [Cyclobacteriaceae bacterium]